MDREKAARWVQHFCEVLNQPEPDDPVNPPQVENILDIDISPPIEAKVESAIKAMKGGKAAWIDSNHAEMLKADLGTSCKVLTDLFRHISEKDLIPGDWNKKPYRSEPQERQPPEL